MKLNVRNLCLFFLSVLCVISVIGLAKVSAQVGYSNSDLPSIQPPVQVVQTINNNTVSVNSSDYWDNLNTPADIDTGDLNDDNTFVKVAGDTMNGLLRVISLGLGTESFTTGTGNNNWTSTPELFGAVNVWSCQGNLPCYIGSATEQWVFNHAGTITSTTGVSIPSLIVTTGLFLPKGTTPAPSVHPLADSKTGLSFSNDTTVSISTGGKERVKVSNSTTLFLNETAVLNLLQHNHDPDNNESSGVPIPHNWTRKGASLGTLFTNNKNRSILVIVSGVLRTFGSGDGAYLTCFSENKINVLKSWGSQGIESSGGTLRERAQIMCEVLAGKRFQINMTLVSGGSGSLITWVESDY